MKGKAAPSSRFLAKPSVFTAFMHLFRDGREIILPAQRQAVKNESMIKKCPGAPRNHTFQHGLPLRPHWEDHRQSLRFPASGGGGGYGAHGFSVLGSWCLFVGSLERREKVSTFCRALSPAQVRVQLKGN